MLARSFGGNSRTTRGSSSPRPYRQEQWPLRERSGKPRQTPRWNDPVSSPPSVGSAGPRFAKDARSFSGFSLGSVTRSGSGKSASSRARSWVWRSFLKGARTTGEGASSALDEASQSVGMPSSSATMGADLLQETQEWKASGLEGCVQARPSRGMGGPCGGRSRLGIALGFCLHRIEATAIAGRLPSRRSGKARFDGLFMSFLVFSSPALLPFPSQQLDRSAEACDGLRCVLRSTAVCRFARADKTRVHSKPH